MDPFKVMWIVLFAALAVCGITLFCFGWSQRRMATSKLLSDKHREHEFNVSRRKNAELWMTSGILLFILPLLMVCILLDGRPLS